MGRIPRIVTPVVVRLWHSPLLMTWASFGVRTAGLLIVFPLVLRRFTPAEVALWQVFAVLISLQMLADMGFGTVFTRLVAYATGGARTAEGRLLGTRGETEPNWELLGRVGGTMRLVYGRLAVLLGSALLVLGTWALAGRVAALGDAAAAPAVTSAAMAWTAWAAILATTVVVFRSSGYVAFLQGTNHVALIRRWEALLGLGSLITAVLVLLFGGGLLGLVLGNQLWGGLGAWWSRKLARTVFGGRFAEFPAPRFDLETFRAAWGPTWRAGIGILMSFGVVQASSLLFAQTKDTLQVAAYLIGIRLVQAVAQLSQAPFYSKLPLLARYWAQGRRTELVALARRGMALSHWAFVVPFVVAGLAGPWLLGAIGSRTAFPSPRLWAMLGLAIFSERYGAMHLQLFSVTNRIVWHIANGVSGTIFLVVGFLFYPKFGVLALPLGMLAGNLGFYAAFSARLSHREFDLDWPQFDLKTAFCPTLVLLSFFCYEYLS